MKRTITYDVNSKKVEREIDYIPVRYIIAVLITLLEVLTILGIVFALCYYVPYFYLAAFATEIFCVIRIIASDDNPDYKVPWLLFVLIIPVAGFMLYFLFYSRRLQNRFVKRLNNLKSHTYHQEDGELLAQLKKENPVAAAQANMLCKIADTHLFTNTKQEYFPLGEEMHMRMLTDLEAAQNFIYMEYFIVEEGKFWNSILDILKAKAADGVEVKVLYDDIGCMMTLPGDYHKRLKEFGINKRKLPEIRQDLYPMQKTIKEEGYVIPFGDGPHPIYDRRVGKSVIQNMLSGATEYAWMTSPYLIIDNDLCTDLENAALRGVDVRIMVPHIPDKKIVFSMTRSFYHRLMGAGVKIYEYEPGFIHAKSYLVDDAIAMIGTINLDYRSLVHHFENGVWMYKCNAVTALKKDMEDTLTKCIEVTPDMLKTNLLQRFICAVVRIFAPMF